MILGTAAYMSPEQAKGKAVDRRADIWASGCVLYEMLSGKRAFDGETTTDVLAAVVMKEPDSSALPTDRPEWIRSLLRRCLHKDAKLRLQAIGEARGGQPRRRALPWAVAAVLGIALISLLVDFWRLRQSRLGRSSGENQFWAHLITA